MQHSGDTLNDSIKDPITISGIEKSPRDAHLDDPRAVAITSSLHQAHWVGFKSSLRMAALPSHPLIGSEENYRQSKTMGAASTTRGCARVSALGA